MQQLHGFDELRNDQEIFRNRSAKIDTAPLSFKFSASYFDFRFLRLAKIVERMEILANQSERTSRRSSKKELVLVNPPVYLFIAQVTDRNANGPP
jgi:hypothetical protein